MKEILLLVIGLLFSVQSFAQDPDLYQTWYLSSYEYDLGPIFYVNDVQPPISPFIDIETNFDYSGTAACNDYFGNFSYDAPNDRLILEFFTGTLSICDEPEHTDFESAYFNYFAFYPTPVYYYLSSDSGNMFLSLEFNPGYILNYQNFPLSISEQNVVQFNVYPNPVSSNLFIASENTQIENIRVYSLSGKQLLEVSDFENSVDVSGLSEGIYFVEILSEEGKSIQKFIKK
jgi:hypothetical protein